MKYQPLNNMPREIEQAVGSDAVALAQEQMAQTAAAEEKFEMRLTWRERLRAAATGRVLAKPGPKPRLREQTYRGVVGYHATSFIGSTEYKPAHIDYDTLDRMRRNGQVALGLAVKRSPSFAATREAEVKCSDPDVRTFLVETFQKPHLMTLVNSCLTSHEFGAAFHEKVFQKAMLHLVRTDEDGNEHTAYDGYAIIPKKYKLNHIKSIKDIKTDRQTQDFDGYIQRGRAGKQDQTVEAWKSLVFALNTQYAGLWGEAPLSCAYPYWYYSELFQALQADWFRIRAINPIIARSPTGKFKNQDDEWVDAMTWTGTVIRHCYDNMVVVLPNTWDEDRNGYKFDYKELNLSSEGGEVYQRGIDALDVKILRSLVVPERTVTQATRTGGYNEAMAHLDAFFEAAKQEIEWFVRHVDNYIFPQLIEWNFRDRFVRHLPKAYLDARTFSESLKAKLLTIILGLIQSPPGGVMETRIDILELLEKLGIPVLAEGAAQGVA